MPMLWPLFECLHFIVQCYCNLYCFRAALSARRSVSAQVRIAKRYTSMYKFFYPPLSLKFIEINPSRFGKVLSYLFKFHRSSNDQVLIVLLNCWSFIHIHSWIRETSNQRKPQLSTRYPEVAVPAINSSSNIELELHCFQSLRSVI